MPRRYQQHSVRFAMSRIIRVGDSKAFIYLAISVSAFVSAFTNEPKPNVVVLTKPGCDVHEVQKNFTSFNVLPISLDVYNMSFMDVLSRLEGKFRLQLDIIVSCGEGFLEKFVKFLSMKRDIPFISIHEEDDFSQDKHFINLMPPTKQFSTVAVGLALDLGCDGIVVLSFEEGSDIVFHELKQKATENGVSFQRVTMHADREISHNVHATKKVLKGHPHDNAILAVIDSPTQAKQLIKLLRVVLEESYTVVVWLIMGSSLQDDGSSVEDQSAHVLGIRLQHSSSDRLHDAFLLLNETYHGTKPRNGTEQALNKSTTQGRLLQYILQQKFRGRTGMVTFDEKGERMGTKYKIVATKPDLQGKCQWKVVGNAEGMNVNLDFTYWSRLPVHSRSRSVSMVTVLDEPMAMVRKEGVKSDKECYLSHPCTKYVRSLENNASIVPSVRCCCVGLMIDTLHWIEKDFDIRAELYFIEGNPYGAYHSETKQWDGIINELIQGRADIALTALEINPLRARYMEYSFAILYAKTRMLVSASKANVPRLTFSFLAPFDESLWRIFLVSIALLTIVVWCLEKMSPCGHYKNGFSNARETFSPSACMSYIWSSVVKLQLDDAKPKSLSARLTTAVFSFATLIITTSYTANLAASLVNLEENFPLHGIRDPKLQTTPPAFRLATVKSTSTEMFFTHNSNPDLRRIGENMKPYDVGTYTEGLDKLRRGDIDAFIYDTPFVDLGASKTRACPFRLVGRSIKRNPLAVGFRKGSSWKEPMSLLFLKYQKKDYFRKLEERWFGTSCLTPQHSMDIATRMGGNHFGGLFLVCLSAAMVCFTLHVLNTCLYKRGSSGVDDKITSNVHMTEFQAKENAFLASLY